MREKEFAMEKGIPVTPCDGENKQRQELLIDGHKVVIRYGQQKNPAAIRAIKSTLLTGIKTAQG